MKATIFAACVVGSMAIWNTCPRGPVGSCMVMGCSAADGPTVCRRGKCVCATGYCRYPNSRVHLQPRRCRAQVPDSSCHATRFCYKGGFSSASCVAGRCLCRTGMHIGSGGQCEAGYWPDEEHCNTDTGGSCLTSGCHASRGPTTCTGAGWESGTGHQCHCQKGYCATKQGTCRRQKQACTRDTGGTCGWFGCHSSRNANCQNGRCVCPHGMCSRNGKCEMPYEEQVLYVNSTSDADFDASLQIRNEEDWEIAMNVLTSSFVVGTASTAIIAALVFGRRALSNRKGEIRINENLLG